MSAEPRLHVEVEGSGPVVVLAHGFGGSARNFLSQARALRDRYRIVRFDARGHARSEAPAEASAYTPEAFVADFGRVLDQVGARAAVVGGLSMGAGTALSFALAHPERVEGSCSPPSRRAPARPAPSPPSPRTSPTRSSGRAWRRRARVSSGARPRDSIPRPRAWCAAASSSTRRTGSPPRPAAGSPPSPRPTRPPPRSP